MKNDNLLHNPHKATNIHCIGIGGIGVSGVARLFAEQNKIVSGSDVTRSDVTRSLEEIGITVTLGTHTKQSIPDQTEVIVYSPAIEEDNPERVYARKKGIIEVSYPEMIGHLMKEKKGIAIAGTHGKTTTTALLAYVWTKAKLDPTVIVGSFVKDFDGSNERLGKSKYFIVEADEYKSSFLNYKPQTIILTSIDLDHLDYYRDINHIKAVFQEFILRLPKDGVLIANADDQNIRSLIEKGLPCQVLTYGIEQGEIRAEHITQNEKGSTFVITQGEEAYDTLHIPFTGNHNILNTLAVYSASRYEGISVDDIKQALKTFKGTWRRSDIVEKIGKTIIMDDYAHHPTEIRALISSLLQTYKNKKIHFIYQPHQEDRFTKLFDLFPDSFKGISDITLAEIYQVTGRRGQQDSSKRLADELKKRGHQVHFAKTFNTLAKSISQTASSYDLIVFVGAGDVIELRKKVVKLLHA